ncbi:MAG: aldo/keto reductase [Clostridia bacterium]|nr:aldo/keto reductase [Clostridia bacterium]
MAKCIPSAILKNSPEGYSMPLEGFGVAAMEPELLRSSLNEAVRAGFRFFDCAPEYGNEKEVGEVLRNCGVPREELFISTKLEGRDHAYDKAIAACEYSLKNMGLDYLDCYLIHWPMPEQGLFTEAWRALEDLQKAGKVRVIGLSNFKKHHIEEILKTCTIKPMANELEINPYHTQTALREYCQEQGMRVINWFPMGGPRNPLHPYPIENYKVLMEDELLQEIGNKYGKTIGQVALRWAIDHGITPIPKSSNAGRIQQNRDVFDFQLTAEEMAAIDALNHDRQMGPDSDTYNEFVDLSAY